ncbi:hypothetical protein [Nostoc edaphicum]|nr:hypothetical protein [Nostoc edaphicum]
MFSADDRYQVNRHETLKFQPFDLLEKNWLIWQLIQKANRFE